MKTTMLQGETVGSHWSVIGNKVYRDNALFAKASNWPDAIAIRDALSCHDDLLEACKVALHAADDCLPITDGENVDGHYYRAKLNAIFNAADALRFAIDRATPQKEGTK